MKVQTYIFFVFSVMELLLVAVHQVRADNYTEAFYQAYDQLLNCIKFHLCNDSGPDCGDKVCGYYTNSNVFLLDNYYCYKNNCTYNAAVDCYNRDSSLGTRIIRAPMENCTHPDLCYSCPVPTTPKIL